LEKGKGIPINRATAAHYYRLAAEQNHASAQYNYAQCLEKSEGISTDIEEALKYYRQAFELGISSAQTDIE
jgi:TPR repeat protein